MSVVTRTLDTMTPEQLIRFEADWPRHNGDKELAIRARGLTPARYYMLLNRAARNIDGIRVDPIVARRVRERSMRAA